MKATRKDLPGSLQVVAGHTCFMICLWWEALPWASQVVPISKSCRITGREERDEIVSSSRAGESMRDRGAEGAGGRSAKGFRVKVLGLGFRPASCVEKKKKDDLGPSVQA